MVSVGVITNVSVLVVLFPVTNSHDKKTYHLLLLFIIVSDPDAFAVILLVPAFPDKSFTSTDVYYCVVKGSVIV